MKVTIALGGGGFSDNPGNLILERYILSQSPAKRPKVCFLPTASGDSDTSIHRFYDAFRHLDCIPAHLSVFRMPTADPEDFIRQQDVLYVGGGNALNLLALWKTWEIDEYVRAAWDHGTILSGVGAGAMCWFEEGVVISRLGGYEALAGLSLLPGSFCPHYSRDKELRSAYQALILKRDMFSGFAADDGVALHFRENGLYRAVSDNPKARAYQVVYEQGVVIETELIPQDLGGGVDEDDCEPRRTGTPDEPEVKNA